MFKPVTAFASRSLAASCLCLVSAAMVMTAAAPARSQTTYKCGTSYSQNPCEGGVALDTDDKRTADQKKQALNATQKEKQAADNLEKTRLDQEKRELAELKKVKLAKKKASAKAAKTIVRPIKNKPLKLEPGAPAEKAASKSQGKKAKAAADGK